MCEDLTHWTTRGKDRLTELAVLEAVFEVRSHAEVGAFLGRTRRAIRAAEVKVDPTVRAAKRLGHNVLPLRRQAGLGQEKLALSASLPRATVGKVEVGTTNAQIATLKKLADPLGVNIEELLEGTSRQEKAE